MVVQVHVLNTVARLEGQLQIRTRAEIHSPHPNSGIASPRFVMVIFQNPVKVIVKLKGDAFAQIIYINHTSSQQRNLEAANLNVELQVKKPTTPITQAVLRQTNIIAC
jgi:hypothetical protein